MPGLHQNPSGSLKPEEVAAPRPETPSDPTGHESKLREVLGAVGILLAGVAVVIGLVVGGVFSVNSDASGQRFEPLINDPFPEGVPDVVSAAGFDIVSERFSTETGLEGFAPVSRFMHVTADRIGCQSGDLECVADVWASQSWSPTPVMDERGVIRFDALTCGVVTRWIGGPDAGSTDVDEAVVTDQSWLLSFTCPRIR